MSDSAAQPLLVFRLFGPMASWGEIAVGEVRPSSMHPTRSALLGLLAAALGIKRHEDEAHARLSEGVGVAVRLDAPGVPLIDYHTVNWRPPKRELMLTRADELRVPRARLNTVQSSRHYRSDALATVALIELQGAHWPLTALQAALERPVFPLSLGRKACPPALPLGPEIVEAEDLVSALRLYDRKRPLTAQLSRLVSHPTQQLTWDEDLPLDPGLLLHRLDDRRDQPLSRRRWRFSVRREAVARYNP